MATITITQLNPSDYGYSSSYIAIGYTLSEYENIRLTYTIRVLMGQYNTSYTYVNPYDIVFTDSQDIYDKIYIFKLSPDTKYQTYFDVEDKNYSEGEIVYANSNKLVFTTYSLISLDESKLESGNNLSITENILKIPLKFPDANYFLKSDEEIIININFMGYSYYYTPSGYLDSNLNYCISIADTLISLCEDKNILLNNELSLSTLFSIGTVGFGEKTYNIILNIETDFINKLPTQPTFYIKSNEKMYNLFGINGIAPNGYGGKFLSLSFNTQSSVQGTDEVCGYYFSKDTMTWYITDIDNISNPKINGKSIFDSIPINNTFGICLKPYSKDGYKNLKTLSSNTFTLLEYYDPIITGFKAERLNGFESETTISFNVFVYNLFYNDVQYNSLNNAVQYGYAKSGENITSNYAVSPVQETIYDNGVEYTYSIPLVLEKEYSYDFVIFVEDQVTEVSSTKSIPQGTPLFCQTENGYFTVGRIPDFNNECKFQTSTDILVNDNGIDIPLLNKIKRHFVCQIDEPTDQLVGGLWIGGNEATSKLFQVYESGLTSEYCNAVVIKTSDGEYIDQNEIPANYKTNRWRGISYRYEVEDTSVEDPMGAVYYNEYRIGNLTSSLYTPVSGISRHGFMVTCRSDEKQIGFCKDDFILNLNGEYVVSFYAKTSNSSVYAHACFDEFIEYPYDYLTDNSLNNEVTTSWKKYQINLACTDINKNSLYIFFGGASTDTYVYFCGAKLERKIMY